MAKDYFQDITPPDDTPKRSIRINPAASPQQQPTPSEDDIASEETVITPERSIRNIGAPERRLRPMRPPVNDMRDPSNFGVQQLPPKPKRPRTFSWWPWIVALILVLVLAGLALFALRKTTVTVTPRSHTIAFDATSQFTAYPALTAASGTIEYTLVSSSLQASQTVSA